MPMNPVIPLNFVHLSYKPWIEPFKINPITFINPRNPFQNKAASHDGHDDDEMSKLLQEEALLRKRQEEVKKKLNQLNSGTLPSPQQLPPKGPPSVAPSMRSDCTGSESEDNAEDGDLGLGLGVAHDPKTGKATWLYYF